MRTPQRLFLIFSATILLMVTTFVLVNNHAARQSLDQSLAERADEFASAYGIAVSSTLVSVSQMATFIAADDQTTEFLARAQDVMRQGLNPGRSRLLADIRYQWLQAEQPRFNTLRTRYGMSELNFYLAEGEQVVNLLRVHRPEGFGDALAAQQHPAYQAWRAGQTVAGPVLDADGLSLRAAAPVWGLNPDTGEELVIGVVEAGLSFDALLTLLHDRLELEAVALLGRRVVVDAVDPSVVQRAMQPVEQTDCYRAALAGSNAPVLAASVPGCSATAPRVPAVTAVNGARFAVVWVPINVANIEGREVGVVALWFDAESALTAYEHTLTLNIAYAVGGFVLLELVLFALLRAGVGFFESELRRRTSEIRQLNRKLTHMATTDALTGLFNRRHFLQRMQVEIDRVRRSGGDIALVLVDLDHFKTVNDRFGHQMGDEVLRKMGQFLRGQVRSIDSAGRYGGEELCVLLPETDAGEAAVIAERLREHVEGMRFKAPDGTAFGITASFGVAQWDGVVDRDTLFAQADHALYAAKDAGRNRVVAFGETTRPNMD